MEYSKICEQYLLNDAKPHFIFGQKFEFLQSLRKLPIVKTNKGKEYYNIPASFDIETTSFTCDGEKRVTMYEWTLDIYGYKIIGRTWGEFIDIYESIATQLFTNTTTLIIYVHNLAYEFQFFCHWLRWESVFSLDVREPLKARTCEGIEFRCSYKLSGYNLQKTGENLQKFLVEKKVGDLDYMLLRHSKTTLTDKEIGYCINDVRVVCAFILEEIGNNGGKITNIPLTKTGYVRRFVRKNCMASGVRGKEANKRYNRYHKFISGLTITPDEYLQLKRAFTGGFTHCSHVYTRQTVYNVTSYDFTSSYPTVLIAEQYPMSKGQLIDNVTQDDFEKYISLYCCIFDIHLTNVVSIYDNEHILSKSKCVIKGKCFSDNGRIVFADELYTTVTEVDYKLLKKFYRWNDMEISNFRRYVKGYLPKPIIESILFLYAQKTQLKGVAGKEVEYLSSKGMINAVFGMMVTDICRDIIDYNDGWLQKQKPDYDDAIDQYNNSKTRFLFYPWGIYCTAYARRNLIEYGILQSGDDYVYSDTDSQKILHGDRHKQSIDVYNSMITDKIHRVLDYYGIDRQKACPKTIKGIEKPLGVWDCDGTYLKFKSLGAKRYLVEYPNHKISLTVSGLNKSRAVPYLLDNCGIPYHETEGNFYADGDTQKLFDYFDDDMLIPSEYTGKNLHTYIDNAMDGVLTDYNGVTSEYHEKSGIHLSQSEYHLSMTKLYLDYILGIKGDD